MQKTTLENEILTLINQIKTVSECIKNKEYVDALISRKKKRISLEKYLDVFQDKNLDSSLYELFGYNDAEIFEMDYQFIIACKFK